MKKPDYTEGPTTGQLVTDLLAIERQARGDGLCSTALILGAFLTYLETVADAHPDAKDRLEQLVEREKRHQPEDPA